jgi:G3E family GTPase
MGIEQPLILDESGVPFESYLELPNGCICCSAKYPIAYCRNDLIASIEYILNNTHVKRVIVETNGLADPSEVTF